MPHPSHLLNAEIYFTIRPCPLGSLLIAKTENGICSIMMDDHDAVMKLALIRRYANARIINDDDVFQDVSNKIIDCMNRPDTSPEILLDLHGTSFQLQVWRTLQSIPVGVTTSYAAIAARIGMPSSFRAVAMACAANPVAILVPCHRVVKSNGSVSGYRWGVERKKRLLAIEQNCLKKSNPSSI